MPAGPFPFTNDEEYQAWLMEDPNRALAMAAAAEKIFAEKRPSMTAAQIEEAEASERQLKHEMACFFIGARFPPLVYRIGSLCSQESITDDEVDELRSVIPELDRFVDLALTIKEPERKETISILTKCRDHLRAVLDGLSE